ncbi:hypothetical protein HDV05_000816 [Chytridiales sp. JEL 0842]|nr:hypothetical protein HDV05_000816 [Chytridiales sp. JEL 0842]
MHSTLDPNATPATSHPSASNIHGSTQEPTTKKKTGRFVASRYMQSVSAKQSSPKNIPTPLAPASNHSQGPHTQSRPLQRPQAGLDRSVKPKTTLVTESASAVRKPLPQRTLPRGRTPATQPKLAQEGKAQTSAASNLAGQRIVEKAVIQQDEAQLDWQHTNMRPAENIFHISGVDFKSKANTQQKAASVQKVREIQQPPIAVPPPKRSQQDLQPPSVKMATSNRPEVAVAPQPKPLVQRNVDEEIMLLRTRLLQWMYISAKSANSFKTMETDAMNQIFQGWQCVSRVQADVYKLRAEMKMRLQCEKDLKSLLAQIHGIANDMQALYEVLMVERRELQSCISTIEAISKVEVTEQSLTIERIQTGVESVTLLLDQSGYVKKSTKQRKGQTSHKLIFVSYKKSMMEAVRSLFTNKNKLTSGEGRIVLITGCDSGFGLATTKELAANGFKVYAGCLTQAGVDHLTQLPPYSGLGSIRAILMDVTKKDSIKNVVDAIESENPDKGLFGLINNAGILYGTLAEFSREDGLRKEFEVNFFGAVSTTLASIPLMRKYGPGARIVTIASIDSDFRMYGFSGYGSSKSAVAHYMDILRLELAPFGIDVTTIKPGSFSTNVFTEAHLQRVSMHFDNAPAEVKQAYGEDFKQSLLANLAVGTKNMKASQGPNVLGQAITKLLLSGTPLRRMLIGISAYILYFIDHYLPEWLFRAFSKAALEPKVLPAFARKLTKKE